MSQKRVQRIELSIEEKRAVINSIINFFQNERDEEIGMIAAEEVFDFFLQNIGELIYKKGIQDAQKVIKERMEDVNVELDLLGKL